MPLKRRGVIPGQANPSFGGAAPAPADTKDSQRRAPDVGESPPLGGFGRREPAYAGSPTGPPPGSAGLSPALNKGPQRAVTPNTPAVRPSDPIPSPDPVSPMDAAIPMGPGMPGTTMDGGMGGLDIEQLLAEMQRPHDPMSIKRRV